MAAPEPPTFLNETHPTFRRPSEHLPVGPSWSDDDLGEFGGYPLVEELDPIFIGLQPQMNAELEVRLRPLVGWWICQFFGTKETEDVLYSPTPIIFQFDQRCRSGYINVVGRVYNMTVAEVRVDSVYNGVVIERNSGFYSNMMVPEPLGDVDRMIHELIETLTVVKYRPEDESIVLSNGKVTTVATRNPQ